MIQIRRTTYHGQPGYLVCGSVPREPLAPARVAIFTRTRAVAERIRDKFKADPASGINPQDFEGDTP